MRKPLLVLSVITLAFLCACGVADDTSDVSDDQSQIPVSSAQASEEASETVSEQPPLYQDYRIKDLGIPLDLRYSQNARAITPWDMIVYKNCLYVGSGDYAANSGPIDMWRYDIENKHWGNSGELPDEEISRFYIIDDTLFAPGIDARESWDFANIYYSDGDGWKKIRTIPDSSHCFDLTVCEDKLFAAIEYEKDQSSLYAAVSENGGQEFKIVPLLKDGKHVPRNSFLTSIFTVKNKTFVTVSDVKTGYPDVYVYDGESFNYYCTWNVRIRSKALKNFFYQKAVFNGDLYLATGYLYKCESVDGIIKINMPNNEIVQDLYIYEDDLYVLGVWKKGSDYMMTVYKLNAPDDGFEKIFEFGYETPAVSFAMSEDSFYFGLSASNNDYTNNGRVLKIEIID